jgi:hypothetical protein
MIPLQYDFNHDEYPNTYDFTPYQLKIVVYPNMILQFVDA